MNDITPPKPTQQETQAPISAEPNVSASTNVSPVASKNNVGKPSRFYKKRGFVIGLIVSVVLVAIAIGVYVLWSQNKVYKIGNYSFGKKDVAQTQDALKVARGGTEAPGGASASQKEAEDRKVMLIALKSEADKNNIAYDNATLDVSMADMYKEYGGKEAYMAYMKSSYSWTPELVYEYRTIEYLKSKLQDKILMNKNFTVIYVRWDIIKDRDGANYQATVAARKSELDTKYKSILESGQDFVKLSSQVEVPTGATKQQVEKAYEQSNGSPVILQTENPGDITYSKAIDANEGIDPQKFFATAKTKGQVIGSQVLSDGRIAVARLEVTGSGKFANWDDYLVFARKQAGLSATQSQSFGASLFSKLAKVLEKVNILKPQVAHALINCANHQVPVNYSFNAYDKNTGASLTGNPFTASASRNSTVCSMANYTANGYTVSGSGTWRSVTKTVWGTPGSITLDCVGYDWAFWAPSVKQAGYTYHSQSQSGTYANGGSISVKFYYTKPATPKPTCTVFSASPTSIPRGSSSTLTWNSTEGTAWGIDPNIGAIGRLGSRAVSPTSTTTYTFIVSNSAGSDVCTATVNVTEPPADAPTCTLSPQSTNLPAGGGSVTLVWSSQKGTAWSMSPSIGQAPGDGGNKTINVTASASYTYTVTNSSGTANCTAYITVGTPPSNCEETNTCPVETFSCTIQASPKSTISPGESTSLYVNTVPTQPGVTWTILPDIGPLGQSFIPPTVSPLVTTKYTAQATGLDGSIAVCDITITVTSPPLAPAYGPWLQSKRGNVLALGYIESQVVGALGSRPATDTSKDAEHVIMGYLANTPQASNFCSKNNYNFGTGLPATCSYASANAGYRANVASQASIGTSNDPAVVSLDRAIAARAGLAANQCTAKAPYLVTAFGTQSSVTLPSTLDVVNDCPMVYTATAAPGTTLALSAPPTITPGRSTLYVKGDVIINSNIIYNFAATYPSVNLIPNLGIVATGDIIISPGVTRVDASLYSLKQVKTCSAYPSPSCNQKLTVRGKLAAAKGFVLGRNYRTSSGSVVATGTTSADPAELIIGSGLIEAFPPPGFVDLTVSASDQQVISTEANPRF